MDTRSSYTVLFVLISLIFSCLIVLTSSLVPDAFSEEETVITQTIREL